MNAIPATIQNTVQSSEKLPGAESLKLTLERVPLWDNTIAPDIAGKQVIVAAHGNSLRLGETFGRMSESAILELNIPTGAHWC